MLKKDELADPKSCLNNAKDEELIFVLLERDPAAVIAVRAWIEERVRLGKNKRSDTKTTSAEQWIEDVLANQT